MVFEVDWVEGLCYTYVRRYTCVWSGETDEGRKAKVNLTKLDPVIYSGMYHSIGEMLGKIGDYIK